ncbi:ribonuclease D [Pontibacter cellulosilyticus]|uniref:Ribonuclease D n=1 Tax=Pontibacter cellulosilyticus TaxID=1720253 RepID=A0A923SKE1_9BACT|nr:ribonuclease D [Pontibacter cellulosilyticus]MBC5994839.1 ribonuclease D [Pontibacter cellulosilyticus]
MQNTSLVHDGITIRLIDTDELLAQAVEDLSKSTELALDLEFDQHRYTYGFNLCLIQLTSGNGICYIIDPFPLKDLQPVYTLLQNENITKIIHHANNDILLLDKLGCNIRAVLDTDVAAKVLNYERSSLAMVLKEEFNKEIDKSQQSSNWNNRPLTEAQLTYAAIDVIYLHKIKDKLVNEVKEQGRYHWLQEENQLLESLTYSEPENPHLKLRNAFRLNFFQQYILKGLFAFRESMARTFNKPASYVINNEALVDLAQDYKTDVHEWLNHTKGIHGGLKKPKNEQLLKQALKHTIEEAKAHNISQDYPENRWIRPQRTPETEARKEELTKVQKAIIAKYGEYASRLIITQSVINEYSQSGKLICLKKYATDIMLETAAEIGVKLPAPSLRAINK